MNFKRLFFKIAAPVIAATGLAVTAPSAKATTSYNISGLMNGSADPFSLIFDVNDTDLNANADFGEFQVLSGAFNLNGNVYNFTGPLQTAQTISLGFIPLTVLSSGQNLVGGGNVAFTAQGSCAATNEQPDNVGAALGPGCLSLGSGASGITFTPFNGPASVGGIFLVSASPANDPPPSDTPEPAAVGLVGAGLGGLAALGYARRKKEVAGASPLPPERN